jgi:glyoxylase-like metal-dependent hydrolase (beta-lactamase superfamily II)
MLERRAVAQWIGVSGLCLAFASALSACKETGTAQPAAGPDGSARPQAANELSYEVFVSDPIPFNEVEKAPNDEARMFSPISSTLILGASEAVLVDPPMTTAQTERVAQWVEAHGKRLKHVFTTHGHGDHWFGTALLLEHFPGATALASPGTIEVMRVHAENRAKWWDPSFPGQIPDSPVVASAPAGNTFTLEGNELHIVEVGHTDTDMTTVLHVPSIGLVVAGDVVYNGVHQYLVEGGNGGLDAWIKALDTVAALQPRHVVAGHKNPALEDDPKAIDETRRYLQDAKRVVASSHTALEYYDGMTKLYPDRLNRSALWFWGAKPLFP